MFKWICYLTGLAFGLLIVVLLFSLGDKADLALSQSNEALTTVNENLPEMASEARQVTQTLALLAEDLDALKQLAGVQHRDKSLVAYANSLLDQLERETSGKQAQVGLQRILGSGLKHLQPVEEFLVGARREATVLVFRARSKQEILHRLSHSWSGRRFFLQTGREEPHALEAWFKSNHRESVALPAFER